MSWHESLSGAWGDLASNQTNQFRAERSRTQPTPDLHIREFRGRHRPQPRTLPNLATTGQNEQRRRGLSAASSVNRGAGRVCNRLGNSGGRIRTYDLRVMSGFCRGIPKWLPINRLHSTPAFAEPYRSVNLCCMLCMSSIFCTKKGKNRGSSRAVCSRFVLVASPDCGGVVRCANPA